MLIRTNINLETRQLQMAKHFCELYHLSISELIRRALAEYIKANEVPGSMFGLLKGQLPDGLAYQQTCRADDD